MFPINQMNARGIFNLGSANGTDKHRFAIKLANYKNLNHTNIISTNSSKNNKESLDLRTVDLIVENL